MRKILNNINRSPIASGLFLTVIIILAFAVRLYKIDNPIADWHSFRQADTASVTRTYLEEGVDLLKPRYHDISSVQSGLPNPNGYRFVEFPVFNLFHLLIYKTIPFVGFDISGRLLSVFCALVSTYLIYLISRKFFNNSTALIAASLYAFLPFNIYFTRVILPEPLGVVFGLVGIWFFIKYLDKEKYLWMFLSVVGFAFALLIKPYMFFYIFPVIYLMIEKYGFKKLIRNKNMIIYFLAILTPFFLWRFWMNQFPEGIPFWKWTLNGDGIRFKPSFWRWIFGERLTVMILGYWGLFPFAYGLKVLNKTKAVFTFFIAGAFLYICIFATANVRHDYYQTIIIPSIVLILADGIYMLWKSNNKLINVEKSLLIFSLGMMFLTGAMQIRDFYHVNHWEIVEAGKAVDRIVPKNDLVIAPYNGDTAFLYQTKRKGWPVVEFPIDHLIERGAKYFVSVDLDHYQTVEFSKRFPIVEKTDRYVILKLQ